MTDPNFYRAYEGIVIAFVEKNDPIGTERFLDDLPNAREASAIYRLCGYEWVQFRLRDRRRAVGSLRQCITQLPGWIGCYTALAEIGESSQDVDALRPVFVSLKAAALRNPVARFGLGELYRHRRKLPEAMAAYEEALRLGAGDPAFELLVLQHMAGMVTASGTGHARGIAFLERALQRATQLGDEEKELECLSGLMSFSFRLGDRDTARDYFNRLTTRASTLENPFALAEAYVSFGTLHRENGDSDLAIDAYRHSLEFFDKVGLVGELANTLVLLGDSEANRGDYAAALAHFSRAERVAAKHGASATEASALRGMAGVHVDLGEFSRAIEVHQRALKIFRAGGLVRPAAGEVGDLGAVYERLGDEAKAEACYRESLRLAGRFVDDGERERLLTHLAELAWRSGRYASATRALRESLALSWQTGNTRFRANTMLTLGQVYRRGGNFPEALRNVNESLDLARSLKDRALEAGALVELGEVYLTSGQLHNAEQAFRAALSLGEKVGMPGTVQLARAGLGEVANREGNFEAATTNFYAAINIIETTRSRLDSSEFKTSFLAEKIGTYERMVDVLIQQDKADEALYYAEKARARSFLDGLAVSGARIALRVDAAPRRAAEIQHEMARQNAVLMEYMFGEKQSYVWTVSGGLIIVAALPARAVIEQRVQRFRVHLAARSPEAERDAGPLYQMLVAPVASHLDRRKALIIVADGALNYIPFEALMPKPQHFLGEDFTMLYAPSASVLVQLVARTARAPRMELLAYGNPDFGTGRPVDDPEYALPGMEKENGLPLTPLPNTRDEIEGIAALYEPATQKTYLGRAATKISVKEERLDDYKRIHFATHAFVDQVRPERSGIVFSTVEHEDGVLRLSEILSLKLKAELVVLSACQTGMGKLIRGEGVLGFAHGFLQAGAARVVVSLWEVNDIATAALMKHFYSRMKAGLRPAQALQAAKLDLMHSGVPAYQQPYFWAPFILFGAP